MKKIILTGDRPTGKLHLGHYFGSLKNRVKLQHEYEQYIMIADLQALTDNFNNPKKVRENVKELVCDYLSVGIDPSKTTIFIQSMIPQISELTMFYSNLVTISRLQRNPTIKTEIKNKTDLFGENGESITYGFLGYPVSQAADITIFNADVVPVGEDQLPLIEQTREIVRKFNSIYTTSITEPEPLISDFPRVKGLDGNDKMGKSLGNAIYLSDDEDQIAKKVMSALTDPSKIKKDDKADPEKCMVYYYHKLIGANTACINNECKAGNRGCVDCKKELIKTMNSYLDPIRTKRKYYENNPEIIEKVLKDGIDAVKIKSSENMKKIKEKMELNYFE